MVPFLGDIRSFHLIWAFPKIWETPQIIHFNKVWNHYFHHPFWWFYPYFWKHPYIVIFRGGHAIFSDPSWPRSVALSATRTGATADTGAAVGGAAAPGDTKVSDAMAGTRGTTRPGPQIRKEEKHMLKKE